MSTPTYEQLYQWRVTERLSVVKIARLLHLRNGVVVELLRQSGLYSHQTLITREWMLDQYVRQDKSVDTIAQELGLDESSVRYHLRRLEIPIHYRSRGSTRIPKLSDRAWLVEQYHVLGKTYDEIAAEVGCARSSVASRFRRFDIPSRLQKKRKNNPHTRVNGHLCFTERQRKLILARDKHSCRMPDCDRSSKRLEVHHIVPRHRGGTNVVSNGITVCRKCHWKTFGREDEFEVIFLSLVQEPLA